MKFKHVSIVKERCRNCGFCIRFCQNKAIFRLGSKCYINEFKCNDCGICIEKCPVYAIKFSFSWQRLIGIKISHKGEK